MKFDLFTSLFLMDVRVSLVLGGMLFNISFGGDARNALSRDE